MLIPDFQRVFEFLPPSQESEAIEYIQSQRRLESHGGQSTNRRKEAEKEAQDAPLTEAVKNEHHVRQVQRLAWLVPRCWTHAERSTSTEGS